MRILFDARMVKGHHGIGRYALTLVQELIARQNEVSLLYSSNETLDLIGGWKSVISCLLPFSHPAESLELTAKIDFSKFDIVHLPSFAVPMTSSKNLVVTIHDMIHLHHPSLAHTVYYQTILKKCLKGSGGVIAVSDWAKSELHQYLEVDRARIKVVRNGLETFWFEKTPTATSPQKPGRKPYFLCLSNTKKHKNIKTLFKAAQELWKNDLDFDLIVSLGGSDLPSPWNNDPQFKGRVTVLKNVPDKELRRYFEGCTALVSPSFLEGYDYGVAEALVQGKPAILSAGSAHDEFNGKLVYFYGAADNSSALADTMKKIFLAPPPLHALITT